MKLSTSKVLMKIGDFCFEEDLLSLLPVTKVAMKSVITEDAEFFDGKSTELYAAGFAGCIVRQLMKEGVILEEEYTFEGVVNYFEAEEDKIVALADEIENLLATNNFNIGKIHQNLMKDALTRAMKTIETSEIMPVEEIWTWEFQIWIDKKTSNTKLLVDDFRETFSEIVDSYVDLEDKQEIGVLKVYETGSKLNILVKCSAEDLEVLYDEVLELDNYDFGVRIISGDTNIFTPELHIGMAIRAGIYMSKYGDEFEDEVSLREAIITDMSLELDNEEDKNPTIRAIDLYSISREESKKMAEELLKEFPENIEVLVLNAGWQVDSDERLNLLEKALEIGEAKFKENAKPQERSWWKDGVTRSYMKAMHLYARELKSYDYLVDAVEIYWELLDMYEDDDLDSRHDLLEILVMERNWSDYRKLRSMYKMDDHPLFVYGDFFYNYFKFGKKSRTKKALHQAVDLYGEVLSRLLRSDENYDSDDIFLYDDVNEILHIIIGRFMKSKKFTSVFIEYLTQHPTFFNNFSDPGFDDDYNWN